MTVISVIVGSTHGNAGTRDGHVARSKVTVGDDRDAVRHRDARVAGGVAAPNDYPDRREDAPRAARRGPPARGRARGDDRHGPRRSAHDSDHAPGAVVTPFGAKWFHKPKRRRTTIRDLR